MDDDVNQMEEQMQEDITGDEIFAHERLVSAKCHQLDVLLRTRIS